MRKEEHWLILYDIRNDRRLARVAKIIESYAVRIQKSVFESDADEKTISVLEHRLERVIDKNEDFILFFNICEKDLQKQEKFGNFCYEQLQNSRFLIA